MPNPTTPQELLRLIDQAADEQWEALDLPGLGRSELPKKNLKERGSIESRVV